MANSYLKLQWPLINACFSARNFTLPLRCGSLPDTLDDDSSDCDSDTDLDSIISGTGPGGGGSLRGGAYPADVSSGGAGAPHRRTSAQSGDACYRCGKKVFPVERVDVGVLFHRRCFRCRVCGLQLTLRTYCWTTRGGPQGQEGQGQSSEAKVRTRGQGSDQGQSSEGKGRTRGQVSEVRTLGPCGGATSRTGACSSGFRDDSDFYSGGFSGRSTCDSPWANSSDVYDSRGNEGSSSRTMIDDVYCSAHVDAGAADVEGVAMTSSPRIGPSSDQVSDV
ncbi:hypothetical protein ACOMHN_015865 [Nucella lapillus]